MTQLFDQNRELYTLLHKACKPYGIDPDLGTVNPQTDNSECTDFLLNLVKQYPQPDDYDGLAVWLDKQIQRAFPALNQRPRWIQSPNWPFAGGEPMRFVGQLDIKIPDKETAATWFHDDTSIYIFISKHAPPKVVIQQY